MRSAERAPTSPTRVGCRGASAACGEPASPTRKSDHACAHGRSPGHGPAAARCGDPHERACGVRHDEGQAAGTPGAASVQRGEHGRTRPRLDRRRLPRIRATAPPRRGVQPRHRGPAPRGSDAEESPLGASAPRRESRASRDREPRAVVGHRSSGPVAITIRLGLPVVAPAATWMHLAAVLRPEDLTAVGDFLVTGVTARARPPKLRSRPIEELARASRARRRTPRRARCSVGAGAHPRSARPPERKRSSDSSSSPPASPSPSSDRRSRSPAVSSRCIPTSRIPTSGSRSSTRATVIVMPDAGSATSSDASCSKTRGGASSA